MERGTINVQTENIFPIIKRYLYSDQEIFLRELVSNAMDATQKLKTLARLGKVQGDLGDLMIEVKLDEENKTLTISDKGLGMTKEEVHKYINQIAFSSAQEFLEKYKDADTVIGHFGLGFYSAFMVADKVEIHTQSYQEGATAVHWSCDGSTEYVITDGEARDRGTDIILHVGEDGKDYLNNAKIEELLKKYCRFLPVDIKFGTQEQNIPKGDDSEEVETFTVDNIINNTQPAWKRSPSELKDEDYISFYRELYPYAEPPLFWIHLNVDFPFNLTGILYFPKMDNSLEIRKDRIHLYCNQVFVTDHVEAIVPDFLTLLHGVIDSPDIPLNVSRSALQSDPEVKKINKHITKKVADKLNGMFKNDREGFEKKWSDISILIKYGILSDDKFYERAEKFCLLENTKGKFFTIQELQEATKALQTDKNGTLVQLYTNDEKAQHSYIEASTAKGYEVLKLNTLIDAHFINHLESKLQQVQFKRVDANTADKLIEKEDALTSVLTEEQETKVKDLFTNTIDNKSVGVTLEAMSPEDKPIMITKPEFLRRMKDMAALSGQNMGYMQGMSDMYNVTVNSNHPIISKVLEEGDEAKQKDLTKQLYDLALLQQNMLSGEDLTNFINRSVNLIG